MNNRKIPTLATYFIITCLFGFACNRSSKLSVEYYPDHKVKERRIAIDAHTDSITIYHENGKTLFSGLMSDGKYDGTASIFDTSGKLRIETQYVDGKKNGIQKGFSSNGSVLSLYNYYNDLKDGTCYEYFPDGKV